MPLVVYIFFTIPLEQISNKNSFRDSIKRDNNRVLLGRDYKRKTNSFGKTKCVKLIKNLLFNGWLNACSDCCALSKALRPRNYQSNVKVKNYIICTISRKTFHNKKERWTKRNFHWCGSLSLFSLKNRTCLDVMIKTLYVIFFINLNVFSVMVVSVSFIDFCNPPLSFWCLQHVHKKPSLCMSVYILLTINSIWVEIRNFSGPERFAACKIGIGIYTAQVWQLNRIS